MKLLTLSGCMSLFTIFHTKCCTGEGDACMREELQHIPRSAEKNTPVPWPRFEQCTSQAQSRNAINYITTSSDIFEGKGHRNAKIPRLWDLT